MRLLLLALGSLTVLLVSPLPAAEPTPYRAARSVHLHYPAPEGCLFANEVVVDRSVNGSYFMACGWNTGYFGIQQLGGPNDKLILFSVWDPTKGDNPNAVQTEDRVEVLFAGEGVQIKRFGGEGTGGQCLWRSGWDLGQTNGFVVAADVQTNKTAYTAWFRPSPQASWKKLATFRTRTGGLPLRGYYSFIEDFRRDGRSVQEVRRAHFGNGWVRTMTNSWFALTRATFTASNSQWESPDNINAGTDNEHFFLATGGDTIQQLDLRSSLQLKAVTEPPAWLDEFVHR